jgi:hypothetical protein
MLLVLLIRMRLLRMRNGDGIYRGGKLLGIRLVVSVFDRSLPKGEERKSVS